MFMDNKWVFWLISVVQTIVLAISAWVLITLVSLMPDIRTNQVKIERNERDIERAFRVVELLDGKVDIASDDRFRKADGQLLESKLQRQLDNHENRIKAVENTVEKIVR